ncbi:MAG: hypothetical protein AABW58_04780 [Nanoarchaeota archaeon]
MKKSTKIILSIIILLVLVGTIMFINNALTPVGSEEQEPKEQKQEETNLETYEEDFKAIDESLESVD